MDEKIETARELRRLMFMMMGLDPDVRLNPEIKAQIFAGNGMVVLNHEAVERMASALRRLPVAEIVESRLDRSA